MFHSKNLKITVDNKRPAKNPEFLQTRRKRGIYDMLFGIGNWYNPNKIKEEINSRHKGRAAALNLHISQNGDHESS